MKSYTLTFGYFEFAGRPGSIHFADMWINRPVCKNMIPAPQPRHQHRKLKITEVGGAKVCKRKKRGLTDLKERIGARDDHGLRARAEADCVKEWPHKYEWNGFVVRFRLHCDGDSLLPTLGDPLEVRLITCCGPIPMKGQINRKLPCSLSNRARCCFLRISENGQRVPKALHGRGDLRDACGVCTSPCT
jgi:hypothetical protein